MKAPVNLEYANKTLYISDDGARDVYSFPLAGPPVLAFSAPYATIDSETYRCNTGIAFDGSFLWLAIYSESNPDRTFPTGRIAQFTTAGVCTGVSLVTGQLKEDLAYGSVTFAPKCAIWAMNNGLPLGTSGQIHAYEVPCPGAIGRVPEFSMGVSFIASLAAVTTIIIRRLLGRREEL